MNINKKYYNYFILASGLILGFMTGYLLKPSQNNEYVKAVLSAQYTNEALKLINSAEKSIKIVMFEAAYYSKYPDSPSNLILKTLKKKAEEGVDVRLILEGGERYLGGRFQKELKEVINFFSDSKVKVKTDRKGINTHAKFILVDDKKLLIGSTNWTYYGLTKNNESNVLVISEHLGRQFAHYFDALWNTTEPQGASGKIVTVEGKILSINKKISHKGKAYEIITLESGIKIFINGHYDYKPGQLVRIRGYKKIYKGEEEIVAQEIRSLSF
ncbi:MAG TPA: hypothetical protein ENL43_01940 [candidate division WOR-3 bacterium]|uniref:phospholipase D n=1 Tax=candidate division WOR-3 bacterium TaxID=2052148 RepID=A0A7V5HMS0_UNCW3|nr:hypothetical protein [candidate division WOR-3 bacterium]